PIAANFVAPDGFTTYNNTFLLDGTRLFDAFSVTFDRPIDPRTFGLDDIILSYRDPNNPANQPATDISSALMSITPLDLTAIGATQFLIRLEPQSRAGTYSYAIGPNINDRIRQTSTFVIPTNVLTFTTTPNLRVPPVGEGGSGVPAQDVTTSTLTVSNITGVVSDVNVHLSTDYPFSGDLVITLVAPAGTRILLANHEPFFSAATGNPHHL